MGWGGKSSFYGVMVNYMGHLYWARVNSIPELVSEGVSR
jgi:hypothetical protein